MSQDANSRLESLLRLAGERDQPSADAMERARAAARQSWRRGAARPTKARFVPWAWAAALAAGLAIALQFWPGPVREEAVATVTVVSGEARLDTRQPVATGEVVHAGDSLVVDRGRVALALGDALSLRVNGGSRLRFEGSGHVRLLEGAVYVDSGGLNARTALRISTPAGDVRHVGTQFQVLVSDGLTRVQVREGRVVLTRGQGDTVDLAAGDLAMAGADLRVEHGQPSFGAAWEWAAATAPSFDIENRPLSEFLAWLAREHGWQTHYVDEATQLRARDIRLHGSMADLDSAGMLERASMVTGVSLVLRDGLLTIGQR